MTRLSSPSGTIKLERIWESISSTTCLQSIAALLLRHEWDKNDTQTAKSVAQDIKRWLIQQVLWPRIREASRSHASDSPSPGEGMGEMVWTPPTSKVRCVGELAKEVDPPGRRHQSAQEVEGVQSSQATGGSDMNRIVVGVDIAKRVFQLHWVEPETGEILPAYRRKPLWIPRR